MKKPDSATLRSAVQAVLDEGLSQTELAKLAGTSGSTVGRWMADKYEGDNAKIERQLNAALAVLADRKAAAAALPTPPAWIATPTAELIMDLLRYGHIAGDMVLVYGGAGVCKTETAKRYAEQSTNVWMITATRATGGLCAMLQEVAAALNLAEIREGRPGSAVLYRAIIKRLAGTQGLLEVDEAQNLDLQALDQLRQIHDATGIGIALLGNEKVYSQMTGGNRAHYLDRLFSRIGQRLRLTRVSDKDTDAIIAAWGLEAKGAIPLLRQIGASPGGLRAVTKTLRLASMFAAGEERSVNTADIKASWKRLGSAS